MSQATVLPPGTRAGRHTLGALRGQWRIGNAYEARLGSEDRLLLTMQVRPGQMDRFLRWGEREVSFARGLPADILAPLDVGYVYGDLGWLSFAPFSGTSLLQRVRAKGALPDREVLDLGLKLARLVSAVHQQGHGLGSLRPTTVLLAEAGPRVLSMGLRRGLSELLSEPPRPARRYQPPELDPRPRPTYGEDVYALGGLLWYALTAEKPPHVVAGHLPTPPSWKARQEGDVATLLDPVVLQAMAARVGDRLPDAAALAARLSAVHEVAELAPGARSVLGLPHQGGFRRVNTDPALLFELLATSSLEVSS